MDHRSFGGTAVLSSLPLQVALYLNCYSTPVWFATCLAVTSLQSTATLGHALAKVAYVVLVALEPGRLYVGYTGNLLEKVPALAAFFFLTVCVAIPCCLYILQRDDCLPLERVANAFLLLFLAWEAWFSARTIASMSAEQQARYRVLSSMKENEHLVERRETAM